MLVIFAEPGVWKNTDPRDHCTYGLYSIVILRPSLTGQLARTGIGDIDTKHDWKILTDFDDHRVIHADDTWDPSWWWVLATEGKEGR